MKIIKIIHELDGYREFLSTDEKEAICTRIRNWRNKELNNTDWTQLEDAPVDKNAWREYRQTLRDLPLKFDDVENIDLPNRP